MPTPLPYCNNLRKDDEVEIAGTGRRGRVSCQPRESSLGAQVLLAGINTPRYFDVTDLRLVVDGKAEDVPPMDGIPPARTGRQTQIVPMSSTPIPNRPSPGNFATRDVYYSALEAYATQLERFLAVSNALVVDLLAQTRGVKS